MRVCPLPSVGGGAAPGLTSAPPLVWQSLVTCLRGPFLAGLVQRMAQDYRHCRGGLPDLVVWNTCNSTYKVRSHDHRGTLRLVRSSN